MIQPDRCLHSLDLILTSIVIHTRTSLILNSLVIPLLSEMPQILAPFVVGQ